jgi:mRNA-degrading endonuclease RelE of RelBE toxin-antitoxin system
MHGPLVKLVVPSEIATRIRTLHPYIKKIIRNSLDVIISSPLAGKALEDELDSLRSYRAGRYRIIYRIVDRSSIEIIAIGPRKTIYLETTKKLRREQMS